jgi:hypothetical protein
MTVAELIEKLKQLPQHLEVCVNDEGNGIYHDAIDAVFDIADDAEFDESAAVVIAVNSQ